MCAAATEESRLNVGRFTAVYCVPSRHPAPERLRQRLDDALEKEFALALEACAARLFSDADESVWLIRRLDISIDLDAGSGRDRLASAWASQFARTLTRELRADAGADNCIRFPNRAAYLASFLGDLSRSSAWDKWYYSVFEGLRVLPQSAALRTAACDRPKEGLAALTSMTRHALEQFVRCLTRQDARRILQSLTEGGGDGTDEGACLEALRASWAELERGASPGEDEEHASLRLCVRACSDAKAAACVSLGRVARALVRLARLLGDASPERARRLTEALAARDLARLHVETLADAETLSPLLRCEPRLLRDVCEELRARASGGASAGTAGDGGARHTRFGGALMLLPALGALPLEEATAGWPRLGRTEPPSLARLLLLAQCCGATRALRLFYDPTARDLLGVPQDISAEEINDWQRGVTRANAEQFVGVVCEWRASRGLLGRLDGLGSLALLRVGVGGRRVALLLDPARGVWLRACTFDRRRAGAALRQLSSCLARLRPGTELAGPETEVVGRTREKAQREGLNGREGLGEREELFGGKEAGGREEAGEQERELLFCDEAFDGAFVERLRESFSHFRVVVLSGALAGELAREDHTLAEFMARRERTGADLLYLSPPRAFGLAAHLRLALSVVAQGLLRDFARRLPGFAQSGLEYLYANFLDCEAVYEEEASRRVAKLGRPPLAVVLSMTGAASGAHRLAWLDERPLAFFQE